MNADPSPTRPPSALSGGPEAWEGTLSALETDVARLESAVNAEIRPDEYIDIDATWSPPADLGQMPEHLRERATMLLSRQLAVAEALVHDITWSRQQRDLAARMSRAQARPTAAFIDNRC